MNALSAVQNAYAELEAGNHVDPDPVGLVIVGHSLGCVIGMNFAAVAQSHGLPAVRA